MDSSSKVKDNQDNERGEKFESPKRASGMKVVSQSSMRRLSRKQKREKDTPVMAKDT